MYIDVLADSYSQGEIRKVPSELDRVGKSYPFPAVL